MSSVVNSPYRAAVCSLILRQMLRTLAVEGKLLGGIRTRQREAPYHGALKNRLECHFVLYRNRPLEGKQR